MTVRVPISGHPAPSVTWTLDGQRLMTEADRREVWVEDCYAVLNIKQCRRQIDRGVYGVRVDNGLGTDEASFTVDITGSQRYTARSPACICSTIAAVL